MLKLLIYRLLRYEYLNQLFSLLIFIFKLNSKDKNKLKYYLKKFSNLNFENKETNLCLFNNLFSIKSFETISFYIFILNIFKLNNFSPAIFSSFKFYSLIKASKIKAMPPLLSYNKFLKIKNPTFSSLSDIKNYKWKKISCGIFALSSTFRELKTQQFDINSPIHIKILNKNLNKSIQYVDSFFNFLKIHQNVKAAVFSDPGYVGQGEMFEILTNKNIPCYQFYMSIDENKMIFKKYLKNNQKEHFDKISNKNWKKIISNSKKNNQIKNSVKNIKKLYIKNSWFPSVGTTRDEKFFSKKKIYDILQIDKQKPIAVIFNHIFWDGTFFYGEDLFLTYREWFIETIKAAYKNRNLNWIIKPHPANKVQNSRYGINETITEEEKIIKKTFGHVPKNFRILKNNNKINSWSLYQVLDYCLTVRGTPGIESAMFGAETIIAGSGRYENRGFTKYFTDKNSYLKYLSNLKNFVKKNKSKIKYATLYAENVFFKKPLKLDSISVKFKKNKTADMDLKIKFNTLEEFKKKKDILKLKNWIEFGEQEFFLND